MNQAQAKEAITQLFLHLRQGLKLGLDELQLALQAVEAGFANDEPAMLEMAEILWCHSRTCKSQLKSTWEMLRQSILTEPERKSRPEITPKSPDPEPPKDPPPLVAPEPAPRIVAESPKSEVGTLPVQAPFMPFEPEESLDLQRYFPVTRRVMVYGWRALRRWVADGAKNVLDVSATIQAATEQGFYLEPVYQRRRRNGAQLLMLIDQNGSMMPFHRFSRDLVETACEESFLLPENVQTFYFHNVPGDWVYRDLYLTEPVSLDDILASCDPETSILIVSDAGAARGFRRQERIQETTRFLRQMRRRSTLIAWLNPMPQSRWQGSSAEILAYLVPMFAMDRLGFGDAIATLRGFVTAEVIAL
jgi:uncharacterized protein